MSNKLSIRLGFLAPKMDKQLRPQGYRLPRRHIADEVNIAISTLRLGGFITDKQSALAQRKLVYRICRDAIPLRKTRATSTPEAPDDR